MGESGRRMCGCIECRPYEPDWEETTVEENPIIVAINAYFDDTSRSQKDTLEGLNDARCELETVMGTLREEIKDNDG